MAGSKGLIIIGVILMVVGLVGGIAGFVGTFLLGMDNPSEEAVETLVFPGAEVSGWGVTPADPQIVTLESGEYDVWYRDDFLTDPDDLSVKDSSGSSVYDKVSTTSSISINGETYVKAGTLDIDSDGDYTFHTDEACTLYVTEPISVAGLLGMGLAFCIGGILLLVVGIVLLIVGIVKSKKAKKSG